MRIRQQIGWLLLSLIFLTGGQAPAWAQPSEPPDGLAVDAVIEVVYPHDRQGNPAPVEQADLVNVRARLYERGTRRPVGCDFSLPVYLVGPGDALRPLAPEERGVGSLGTRYLHSEAGISYPVWEWNDREVGTELRFGRGSVHFAVAVPDAETRTTVWTHAVDARAGQSSPSVIGRGTVGGAPFVYGLLTHVISYDEEGNFTPPESAVTLTVRAQLTTPRGPGGSISWDRPVRLMSAFNHEYATEWGIGELIEIPATTPLLGGGEPAPVYEFRQVDVSRVQAPDDLYRFWIVADGLRTTSIAWVHGATGRTVLPEPERPTVSGDNCPAP
jgi:hypothetical protein